VFFRGVAYQLVGFGDFVILVFILVEIFDAVLATDVNFLAFVGHKRIHASEPRWSALLNYF
jgi:hypothetical protein